MTAKDLLYKQIIIFMDSNNAKRVIAQSNVHVSNINKSLKDIKLEITIDFIRFDKNLNNVDSSNMMSLRLSQSKSYLKILDILYFVENTNLLLTSNIIEKFIKTTHIFNDVVLASYLYIIKTSSKSDIAVIWIDIQDSQNSIKNKMLINRCFNISPHIAIIKDTNMNSGIPQYKNC